MDRFDKFSDHAREALTHAQAEAVRLQDAYIGTEHLLLGLLRVESGRATVALRNLGAEPNTVRTAVEFIVTRGSRPVVGEVGLTPGAKRVIELAIDEARRQDHPYLGTEHLLLGLIRVGDGIAAGVLESVGITLDGARAEVTRLGATRRWPRRGPFGSPVDAVPAPRRVDEATNALEVSRLYASIGASPLERVVGIGQVAVDAGVSVELIALEIRTAGCILHWKAHPEEERAVGEARGTAGDDAGNRYHARPASWVGNSFETKGELLIIPAPPATARTMVIDLSSFEAPRRPPSTDSDDLPGTWHFEVTVRS